MSSLDTPSLTIHMKRFSPADGAVRGKPVLLIPGYGMNSFILSYHPDGASLVSSLVARGLEVWTMDWKRKRRAKFDLGVIAREGVTAAVKHVLAETRADAHAIDLIGCSLGTTLLFSFLAHLPVEGPDALPIGSLVTLAGVVTWNSVHPLVRVLFASKRVIGAIPMRGTRALARAALPALATGAPGLLSLYVHAQTSNLSQPDLLVQTVEDPDSDLNREIAGWIRSRELMIGEVNVSSHLKSVTHPLLCVLGRQDGVVPATTARLVYEHVGSTDKTLLEVGDENYPVAHADLFIGRDAEARVFRPVGDFLLARGTRPGVSSS